MTCLSELWSFTGGCPALTFYQFKPQAHFAASLTWTPDLLLWLLLVQTLPSSWGSCHPRESAFDDFRSLLSMGRAPEPLFYRDCCCLLILCSTLFRRLRIYNVTTSVFLFSKCLLPICLLLFFYVGNKINLIISHYMNISIIRLGIQLNDFSSGHMTLGFMHSNIISGSSA